MKLDPRIKSLSDILSCFDLEQAKQFIGQKGYFTDFIENYQNLVNRCYGTLIEIKDDSYAFKCEVAADYWRFFIPESKLKSVEKKYRPYTLEEFQETFTIGCPINFRKKDDKSHDNLLLFLGYTWLDNKEAVEIGNEKYSLDVLFNDYEYKKLHMNDFKPFGVVEE